MTKWHESKKGEPAPCDAEEGNCPLKNDDGTSQQHYNSRKEAEQAIESRNSDKVVSSLSKKRDEKKAQVPTVEEIDRAPLMKKKDRGMVHKLREGKKVSDKTLDQFLFARREMQDTTMSLNDDGSCQKVYAFVKDVRDKRKTPSTFVKAGDFDPKLHTTVKDATMKKFMNEGPPTGARLTKLESHFINRMTNTRNAHEWALTQSQEAKESALMEADEKRREYNWDFSKRRAEDAEYHGALLRTQIMEYKHHVQPYRPHLARDNSINILEKEFSFYDTIRVPDIAPRKT